MRLAMLDFDITLSKDYSMNLFSNFLYENKRMMNLHVQRQAILEKYFSKQMSFDEMSEQLPYLWASSLKDTSVKGLEVLASEFFPILKKEIHDSSYELINLLKANGYYTVIISAAAYEIISLAGQDLGVHETRAMKIGSSYGFYSGRFENNISLPGGKKKEAMPLLRTYGVKGSFSFGDSKQDLGMMEPVEHAIALNPNKELIDIANEKNWPIMTYENVVPEVEKILKAKTI
jgi:HAD superfamily phosphoserine phosphatase-like hydrolase